MIKGTQKQMIVLRTGDSRYFDEAYFVLRREIKADRRLKNDILLEANRILEESRVSPRELARRRRRWWLGGAAVFLVGSLCGGGISLLICLLL